MRQHRNECLAHYISRRVSFCYMARKKTKLDIAVKRTAEIIEEHVGTLSRSEAKAMLGEIHALAVKPSHSANHGKASRSRQSAGLRPLSRDCAKSA